MGSSGDRGGSGILASDKGISGLLKDLKLLQIEASKSGDLKFTLKDSSVVKAHSILFKARCKNFTGDTNLSEVTQETFSRLLAFIYTGKLKVDTTVSLFSLYILSIDLGLEDLSTICEELISSNLEQNSALGTILQAVDFLKSSSTSTTTPSSIAIIKRKALNEELEGKVQRVIDCCVTHLSENNPGGLKRNPVFLNLPVHTVLAILDSEHLCLEEEEVWRCVLRWAQHKSGVESHVSVWSEGERLQVSQFLTPVISHVRLLLIDSRVFAEEVEPTGCVPMALSLERYRYAALSSFEQPEGNGSDPRLTPRNAQKLFHSSLIINSERVGLGKKLHEWHLAQQGPSGNTQQGTGTNWKCVYRATLHGFSAEEFHRRVDGVGPTYVLVLLKNTKWVCGGYTDIPWSSSKSPKYATSANSFLFSCPPGSGKPGQPVKFNVTKKHFAVCHDANSGPIFGAGADLYIASMCATNSDSYSNLPHSYEQISLPGNTGSVGNTGTGSGGSGIGKLATTTSESNSSPQECSSLLTPSYHFMVADYEVFTPNV